MPPPAKTSWFRIITVIAVVFSLNIMLWALVNFSRDSQGWEGAMKGVSFTPYRNNHNPNKNSYPTPEEITEDVHTIAPYVRSIRTYSSTKGQEIIPAVALKDGLWVTMGAWVGAPDKNNLAELQSVVTLANQYPNINRVLVGNEVLQRGDETVDALVDMIRWVKRRVKVKVSTAEPWHIWLKNPRLAAEVDFITIHTLPYWEGKPVGEALDYAMQRYDEVARAFPGKPILIGEIGWPSAGQWIYGAEPSQANQARFIRDFLNLATQRDLDYFVVEAFDQNWKWTIEGSVGANWGLWDASRKVKFPLVGKINKTRHWLPACLVAMGLALLPLLLFLRKAGHLSWRGQGFYACLIMMIVSVLMWSIMVANSQSYTTWLGFVWAGLILFQFFLFAVLLVDGLEFAETLWTTQWQRRIAPALPSVATAASAGVPPPPLPKVSIHVPCYNEPPQMVKETLDALAAIDYPHFEVLVIDNNTKDDAVWQPVQEYCRQLGERFRFFHLPTWPGFKAGALNFALSQTAADAAIIAVIDSDYQVQPNWLASLVPVFAKPEVGFVQSPQDYRDWHDSPFKAMCHWEYAGFFHIGMVTRNERNAIIQHGTMTLIRASALRRVHGWAEWCICEDAELGLKLFEAGYQSYYLNQSFGKGLIPDSFSGYKSQRFRWAYGAVQIMKRHAPFFAPLRRELTLAQKYHFIAGWLPWLADAANLVFVGGSLLWSILLFFGLVEFPPELFLMPTIAVFLFKLGSSFVMYGFKIKAKFSHIVGAAVAGTALSHVVGMAMLQGLFTSGKPFLRTPKCEDRPALYQAFAMAADEMGLLVALLLCATAIVLKYSTANEQASLWAWMLAVQSLPYLSAVVLAFVNVRKGVAKGDVAVVSA